MPLFSPSFNSATTMYLSEDLLVSPTWGSLSFSGRQIHVSHQVWNTDGYGCYFFKCSSCFYSPLEALTTHMLVWVTLPCKTWGRLVFFSVFYISATHQLLSTDLPLSLQILSLLHQSLGSTSSMFFISVISYSTLGLHLVLMNSSCFFSAIPYLLTHGHHIFFDFFERICNSRPEVSGKFHIWIYVEAVSTDCLFHVCPSFLFKSGCTE